MKKFLINFSILILFSAFFNNATAQIVENDSDQLIEKKSDQNVRQTSEKFLGVKLHPEVQAIIVEIEKKTGRKILSQYIEQGEFMLGSNYISEDGIPVVLIDYKLQNGDRKKLEAIITHELLHLRLRVNGYPTFLFSDSVNTAKGRAIDTEQDSLNDLISLIEHQIFKADLEKFGLYKYINLAGDTADGARKNKGKEDSQADAINYARAILEYPIAKDIEEVKRLYIVNKWTRSLREGEAIAGIIRTANIKMPKDVDSIFIKCLSQLFPLPGSAYTYKLTSDPNKKVGRRMIVSISRQPTVRKRRLKGN